MLVADLSQALQIAFGRWQYPGGTGHWLDNHRGNIGGIVESDQVEQVIGKYLFNAGKEDEE